MAWTAGGDLGAVRRGHAGGGSNSAAFAVAGYNTTYLNTTEEYDGSTWAAGGNISATRHILATAGSLTAGLCFGGQDSTPTYVATTEEYDGTTWTAGGSLSTARYYHGGFGTQTAGVATGGSGATLYASTEEYVGSTWSAGGDLAAAKANVGGACGVLTAGLAFGGNASSPSGPALDTNEEYDGTNWASGGTLATARTLAAGSGTQTDGLAIAGAAYSGSWTNYSSVERYDGSAWSAFDSINTARRLLAAAQSGDTSICFGGYTTGAVATTEMGATIFGVTSLIGTFTLPAAQVPTYVAPSSLIGTFTLPAPTIVSSIKVLADPLTATFVIPDVIAGVGVVAVDPLIATFTMPAVTVTLPCIVTVSPLTGTFYILDPYAVVSQKSILFGAYNLPNSKTMSYKIVDDAEVTIQDWTTTGVVETVVDATANKSIYSVRTNKVNENFQGKIMWKSSDATPLTAVEIINVYSSYVDILQNRLTAQRATSLDNLDGTVSSVLTETQSHPTLAEMLAGGVAKEATLATAQADITSLITYAVDMNKWKNNKLERTSVVNGVETWVLYDDDNATPLHTWTRNATTLTRTKAT